MKVLSIFGVLCLTCIVNGQLFSMGDAANPLFMMATKALTMFFNQATQSSSSSSSSSSSMAEHFGNALFGAGAGAGAGNPLDKVQDLMGSFRNYAMLGQQAARIFNTLHENSPPLNGEDSANVNMISTIVDNIKEKLQKCYDPNEFHINEEARQNDYDYTDPVTREFMVIVRGVNELRDLLEKEGYIRHIHESNKYILQQQKIPAEPKDFWIMKLTESKAFLKILCGMMNVEWDILVTALIDKIHSKAFGGA